MHRLAIIALLLVGMAGCGGGGIQEGMPPNAGQGLTPEQQKEHDDLVAKEEAASKAQGKDRQ
jgi:hypothetical protein